MALGKNFNNILGDYFGDEIIDLNQKDEEIKKAGFCLIDVKNLELSPFQTRVKFDEAKILSLAKSIDKSGLLSPVIVLEKKLSNGSKQYILLAGERRLRAIKSLGHKTIPAIVKTDKEISRSEQALITATENLQRENLTPLELAKTYEMLISVQNIDEKDLAKNMDLSPQHIRNYLKLLTLGKAVKQALLDEKIGEGHARFLVGLEEKDQEKLLKIILAKELTVKEVEKLIKGELSLEAETKEVVFNARTSNSHNISPVIMKRVIKFTEQFPNAKLKTLGDDKKGKIIISWEEKEEK